MPIQAFLVVPLNSGDPHISDTRSTDPYLATTFGSNASVIPVNSYSFTVENAVSLGSASGGATVGKLRLNTLSIKKPVDKASPYLFSACAVGGHFAVAQLYIRHPTAGGVPFLAYEFQTVYITNIDWSGDDGDDQPAETVTLAYGALVIAYQPTNPDGSPGPTVRGSWDQINGTAKVVDTIPLK